MTTQMKRILFLFFTLFFFKRTVFGQNSVDARILLRATTSVAGGEYFIDILPQYVSTKIIFKLKNRMRQFELEADTNTIRYRHILDSVKNFNPNNDTVKTYLEKLDLIYLAYTLYDTDSIIVLNNENKNYVKLIQEVLKSPTEVLENKNHIVLDGTRMNFILTNNDIIRTVYAHSPTSTSNPILYKLITETTSLYRKNKMNNFLSEKRTNGY